MEGGGGSLRPGGFGDCIYGVPLRRPTKNILGQGEPGFSPGRRTFLLSSLSGLRKGKGEGGAVTEVAFCGDGLAVRFDDVFYDGEA